MFAHALLLLGITPHEINANGHPDVVARSDTGTVRFEVEAWIVSPKVRPLDTDNLDAIRPAASGDAGYFAVLDCSSALQWIVVGYDALRWRRAEPVSLASLEALCETRLSNTMTDKFCTLVRRNSGRIRSLTFPLLSSWALRGQAV
jgi:hypothetical protein